MKKNKYIVIGLCMLALNGLKAQDPGHYLHVSAGGGIHNLSYKLTNGTTENQFGYNGNLAYSFFFSSKWGVQTGVGVQTFNGLGTMNNYLYASPKTDGVGNAYDYRISYNYWKEKQKTMMVDIPLALQFRQYFNHNVGFLASVGGKIAFPLKTTFESTGEGELKTTGYYPQYELELADMPSHNFSASSAVHKGDNKFNMAYFGIADLGFLFKMTEKTDFYLGGYINYGLNNILKSSSSAEVYQVDGVYNGMLASNQTSKVTPISYGIKMGFYFAMGKKDHDKDGVSDRLDKCPNTPLEARGKVGKDGCPIDTDGDGVADYLDKCPNTPAEARGKVDKTGCPLDSDGDGVPDYLDKCPNTPVEARGHVGKDGCPLDSDGDGIFDYLDKCPDTPKEALGHVDQNGCPIDSDGDGVADYLDKCPNTPKEARASVGKDGCPLDTDGDGVLDYLDRCPKVKGVATNKGCPEVKKEVKALFKKALQGIQFETGKYIIKPVSFSLLNQIAKTLILNPTYLIEVQGHTDNVGKPASNLTLSTQRAEAVKNFLIKAGVEPKRLTSNGYGDTVPVASNKTPLGRSQNRRVEFVVTFEEVINK